ncbi:MAG TPA: pyridoxamine 5'-phosphate oxidase family protein [Opitutaceae bacterium]|nr:pyridoxamine 5'-phosphate oxidase family protein [Opitutaceae bacterium]
MAENFLALSFTPSVRAAQRHAYGRDWPEVASTGADRLGEEEMAFIRLRDSFYLATVSETGWPYVQHRGGPAGFLHVLDDHTLAFADRRGNRQLLSTGNLAGNDRVALFLMDYPRRERLKILGHARTYDVESAPPALAPLLTSTQGSRPERIFQIDVAAFDWNCPQYITPRYTAEEVEAAVQPLRDRLAQLEERLRKAESGNLKR